jgi:methylated-DNA-[protein]-cysteine S-methyltransferase
LGRERGTGGEGFETSSIKEHGDSDYTYQAAQELDAYFAGRLRRFTVPLDLRGTPFQRRVWEQLRAIPYGQTRSYGQVAGALEQPTAMRAVGHANGCNPVSIIVPCHRVIGAGGALVGYGGGLERKQALLELEARVLNGQAGLPTR